MFYAGDYFDIAIALGLAAICGLLSKVFYKIKEDFRVEKEFLSKNKNKSNAHLLVECTHKEQDAGGVSDDFLNVIIFLIGFCLFQIFLIFLKNAAAIL